MNPNKGTLNGWLKISPSAPKQNASASGNQGKDKPKHSEAAKKRRAELAAVAKETQLALEDIIPDLPASCAPDEAERVFYSSFPPLAAAECPKRNPSKTHIHVVNGDSFNIAIRVGVPSPSDGGNVAVLNMASHVSPGGGWLNGAMAQEEALCYRSSLSLSLHKRFYPWKQLMGLYTRDVVIIRSDMASGHKLYDPATQNYKFVTVLSIAALRCPPLKTIQETTPSGVKEREVFAKDSDRIMTKDKMRLCLRMAARKGHRSLVLGALGCGAFCNPPEEVAMCWLEVLREQEFSGGWWDGIWFAIYDTKNEGNFEVFERVLDGVEI